MHRTTIRFTDEHWAALCTAARKHKLSTAALIRGHLASYNPVAEVMIAGVPVHPGLLLQVKEWWRAHQKIQAIKQVRSYYQPKLELKLAKAIVDELWIRFATDHQST